MDTSVVSPGPEGHDTTVTSGRLLYLHVGLLIKGCCQASAVSIDGNLAHEIRRLCTLYRYFVFRAKAQIDRCLSFVERSPRAKLILVAGIVGFVLLVLRKLGHVGMRILIRVSCEQCTTAA